MTKKENHKGDTDRSTLSPKEGDNSLRAKDRSPENDKDKLRRKARSPENDKDKLKRKDDTILPSSQDKDRFRRPANEDDDGYDPWSDRVASNPLWEEDPWS